ncbi:MAG: WG repeat-containing protein [Peptococcaceae bacterium]|nr:WG repeat-containing protein [Peptococcaceae bacterium]
MKTNATLIMFALLILTGAAWFAVFNNITGDAGAFQDHCREGDILAAKGIYIDAVKSYEKALSLNPKDYGLAMKIADAYKKLSDTNGFLQACDKAIKIDPTQDEPYVLKAEHYLSRSMYAEARGVLADSKKVKDATRLDAIAEALQSKYFEKYVSLDAIGDWRIQGKIDYVPACDKGQWGMAAGDGTRKIKYMYDYLGAYSEIEEVIPCCYEGEYYYIDIKGNRKLVGDRDYEFLGSFGDGYAPAQYDGIYGYINTKFQEQKFEYDYAGAFANGVAAVKKGEKWALIDKSFKEITGFEYDDILIDSNGFCSLYSVVVLQQGGAYRFYDVKGKKFSDRSFDEAKPVASPEGAIAVRFGDLWGFADKTGRLIIEPQYEEANSFSLGFAPFRKGERWGYLNEKNETAIEPKFYDAKPFSGEGTAVVRASEKWYFIGLCQYEGN